MIKMEYALHVRAHATLVLIILFVLCATQRLI